MIDAQTEREPLCDKYGTRLDGAYAHVGTLYDIHRDLNATVEMQRRDIIDLRSMLLTALELLEGQSAAIRAMQAETLASAETALCVDHTPSRPAT